MLNSVIDKLYRIKIKTRSGIRYSIRRRDGNIYHCCMQKTASQWFKQFFNDPIIWRYSKFYLHEMGENFLPEENIPMDAPLQNFYKLEQLPLGAIISPLYLRHVEFLKIPKPEDYKAFFIMRDPRDLMVSEHFSTKYSHAPNSPYVIKTRARLMQLSDEEGIMERIKSCSERRAKILLEWLDAADRKKDKVFRFEDLFGKNQENTMKKLLDHCGIRLPDSNLQFLLNKYSFRNLAGRERGIEDNKKYLRKGVEGDWKNHFSDNHKDVFKKHAGTLLIKLGYEKDTNW